MLRVASLKADVVHAGLTSCISQLVLLGGGWSELGSSIKELCKIESVSGMASGSKGNGSTPGKVKPGSSARSRTPRNGSSYVTCPHCFKTRIHYVLLQMHVDHDCEVAKDCGGIQRDSMRSVEETQQPVAASRSGDPDPAEESVCVREKVDWVKDFSLSSIVQLIPSLDGEDDRFLDIDMGTDNEDNEECEQERSCQDRYNDPVMELQTQLEEAMTVGQVPIIAGDRSVEGESMVSRKAFEEISDSLATLRNEFQKLLKEKEELVKKLGELTVQKAEAQTVLDELLVQNEELQADNKIREETYNKWREELEGRLTAQEAEAKLVQQNLDFLVKSKKELEDAKEDAERQRTERQRTQEELTSWRTSLKSLLQLQRHSIDSDNIMHSDRLRNRKFILERYEALMRGQTSLSSLVADMGNGQVRRTEPSEAAIKKVDRLMEELKSWPNLPQQVDHLFAAVEKVVEQAGVQLMSSDAGCLKENSPPCKGESPLSQCFFDGLEEPAAQRSQGLPLHARTFLTTLPVECLGAELPSTLSSPSSPTLPDKSSMGQAPLKVTWTRPLLELDTQRDSIHRELRADTVASALPRSQPGPPAQVTDTSVPVDEHRIATGPPAVRIASPLNEILTGPSEASSGRSIYSLLGAFPPANGPGVVPQVLSTPAQDVTVGKTSFPGNNTKRYLNLEVASEKGSDVEQRLPHRTPAAATSLDVSRGPEIEIAGKANDDHPASSRGNDEGQAATSCESDSEEHLVLRSARKGNGSGGRPCRRNQVASSSDSESEIDEWRRSTRRRMSFHSPLSENKTSEKGHPVQLVEASLNYESARIVDIDKTPGKRKDHSILRDASGSCSPLKRLRRLRQQPAGEEEQTSPSARRSRRLRKRQDVVESDSVQEEGSTDDEPVRVTPRNASRQEKMMNFIDLTKECDDACEDEINEEWSSGEDGFINDEPLSDNCCSGSKDGSEAGDVSESSAMEVRPQRKALDWSFLGEMTAAFGKDDLLCMRAVCCLFRQQTQVEQALHIACNRNGVGFDMSGVKRGSELAVFLSSGEPDHKLTKSVEELKEKWPKGVLECRNLAFRHATQLFRIYKENLDPFPQA